MSICHTLSVLKKEPIMVLLPEKRMDLQALNLTLGVTWGGFHLTTPLPLGV